MDMNKPAMHSKNLYDYFTDIINREHALEKIIKLKIKYLSNNVNNLDEILSLERKLLEIKRLNTQQVRETLEVCNLAWEATSIMRP